MNCDICDSRMSKYCDWLEECNGCGYAKSTLESGAGRGVDGLKNLRQKNFQKIIKNLQKLTDFKNLECLEVGPAEGWFLEAMSEYGCELTAIEASDQAKDLQDKGYNALHGFFPGILPEDKTYDMIVFNDVFEHLPDPIASIKACERHLKPGGYLVLNLPNKNGIFYRIAKTIFPLGVKKPFERLWQKDLPSPHITYFSDKNITGFVDKHTDMKECDKFFLSSIIKDGLKDRITTSYAGLKGTLIYAALVLSLPVLNILPKDIMVFVYQKPNIT